MHLTSRPTKKAQNINSRPEISLPPNSQIMPSNFQSTANPSFHQPPPTSTTVTPAITASLSITKVNPLGLISSRSDRNCIAFTRDFATTTNSIGWAKTHRYTHYSSSGAPKKPYTKRSDKKAPISEFICKLNPSRRIPRLPLQIRPKACLIQ